MSAETKFGMLRKVLRAIGLSQQSADDVVNFIVDVLAGERADAGTAAGSSTASKPQFPYHLRDHFLSAAELSFYGVLRTAVQQQAVICTKVNLHDLFYVKQDDPSRWRVYTNKIDRKHIDFLLCDPATMRPLVGIELDDKSHERKDRQERDTFVDEVFRAARLPLVRVAAKQGYNVQSIADQLAPFLKLPPNVKSAPALPPKPAKPVIEAATAPSCPKCGSVMILRTSKKGENAGSQFWGCSKYPTCRTMQPYEG